MKRVLKWIVAPALVLGVLAFAEPKAAQADWSFYIGGPRASFGYHDYGHHHHRHYPSYYRSYRNYGHHGYYGGHRSYYGGGHGHYGHSYRRSYCHY